MDERLRARWAKLESAREETGGPRRGLTVGGRTLKRLKVKQRDYRKEERGFYRE